MRHQFTLSDVGLKLIKSYEGFRPTARQLETGRRVAGYGHVVGQGQSVSMSKAQAEDVLIDDLAPYVALVNDHVFAPLTQGQFDALVSLAFNIGADAFLGSSVLSAVNNGRILDAANAFDVWRKGVVGGQVYVVDALVRRRTSEKIMFLRPEKALALAPRIELPPFEDDALKSVSTYGPDGSDAGLQGDDGIVERATDMSAHRDASLSRRREDGPAGILTLSEIYDDNDIETMPTGDALDTTALDAPDLDTPDLDTPDLDTAPLRTLPSTEVAEDLGKRMDALMASPRRNAAQSMPDRLVDGDAESLAVSTPRDPKILPFTGRDRRKPPRGRVPDEAATTDASGQAPRLRPAPNLSDPNADTSPPSRLDVMQAQNTQSDYDVEIVEDDDIDPHAYASDSAARYIQRKSDSEAARRKKHILPFVLMCVSGMILMGGSAGLIASGADARWGLRGESATTAGFLIGALLLLGSVYYVLKISFRKA